MDNFNIHRSASRPAQFGQINYWAWLVGAPVTVALMMLLAIATY